jgi:hypothetical protein
MAFPTVRNRGRGYSNRFTLCRGCTLVPQHLISSVGISPNHRNTVRGSSTITFHLQILVWAPLPMSLASQWRPTVNLGTAQGLAVQFTSISHHFSTTEAASSVTPMTCVQREPILRRINFQLSPTHNQVLWGYLIIGKVSHSNQHHCLSKITIFSCSHSPSKIIQWNASSFQGFKITSNSHCSHLE